MDEDTGEVSLSDLQLALMRQLWARGDGGEASTTEIVEALRAERPLAHTTVATLLNRLEKRGLVTARREGRGLVYQARVSESQVQRSMVSGLLSNLFAGQASALLSHLVDERAIGSDDLERMRALLERGTPAARRKGGTS